MKVSRVTGRTVIIGDQEYLYFYGTSYLGLPYDERFIEFVVAGHKQYGSSLGSSPLSSPQLDIYDLLESELAQKYGAEAALLFPSGFAAGQAIIHIFEKINFKIVYGNIAHPALSLERKFLDRQDPSRLSKTLHAVDYIDPITFEMGNLEIMNGVNDALLLDASHAFGLFDDDIKARAGHENMVICGSLNKAMGINAGVVLCDNKIKNQLRSSERYITASGPSPAECYALLQAMKSGLLSDKQEKLKNLINVIPENDSIKTKRNFPVLTFFQDSGAFYDWVKQEDILIWRNKYPSVSNVMINRAVITAAHTEEDIQKLVQTALQYEA